MNKKLIANELVKIAKSLTADGFDKKEQTLGLLSELQKSYYRFFEDFLDWKKEHRHLILYLNDRKRSLLRIKDFTSAFSEIYHSLKSYDDQKENTKIVESILRNLDAAYKNFANDNKNLEDLLYDNDKQVKPKLNEADMELQKLKLS